MEDGIIDESSAAEVMPFQAVEPVTDGQPDQPPPQVPSNDRLVVEVDHVEHVTYALVYNRQPIIRSLRITNAAGGLTGPLTVRAAIAWSASSASPSLPFEVVVDLPSFEQSVVVNKLDFRLDDTVMADVVDTTQAHIELELIDATGLTQRWRSDLTLHARTQWLSDPKYAQITAAFVQPNHPSVNEVLARAGAILEAQGRDRALSGYQSEHTDPDHVRAIGAAVFTALQSFVDQYINPPAGYEEVGQKIRPIDEVLATRQGTCIDLACAYAACLEQAGLHPVVFLVHGHAFTGFYLASGAAAPASVVSDFSTAAMLVESGLIASAETTMLADDSSFEAAQAEVRAHFAERSPFCPSCVRLNDEGWPKGERPHLRSIVDVRRCRHEGVLPLPVRFERDGVLTIIIDPGPSGPVVVERRDVETRKLLPQTVPARVQQWKNDLLDLTFRNSLLSFKPARSGAEIVIPKGVIGSIEDKLSDGQPISVIPHDQLNVALREGGFRFARDLDPDELSRLWNASGELYAGIDAARFDTRIRNLVSRAKVEEQDTGSNNLYMTFGTLKWTDPRSTIGEVRSPIFMTPIRVKMKRGRATAEIIADPAGFTTINYCLIEALRAKMKMSLQWFSDDMSDAFGLNVDAGLQAMRAEILDRGLTASGFEVIEDSAIGFLRFSKIRLWKDLDENWERFSKNSIVGHLIEGGRRAFVDPADPERLGVPVPRDYEILNPQSADGPQALAVRRALAGHSFVLEGPPGTGKSQTITNLLAAALASGKKVLFVAEKQAALEVVHERLAAVGLDPFCLELHDKGAKPEKVKAQLRDALDFSPTLDQAQWERVSAKFETTTQYLDSYREKVHGENEAGMSYYEAYVRLLLLGQGPEAACTRRIVGIDSELIVRHRAVLDRLEDVAQPAQPRLRHSWGFAGPVDFETIDRSAIASSIGTLAESASSFSAHDPWSVLTRSLRSLTEVKGVASVVQLQLAGVSPTLEQWRSLGRDGWFGELAALLDGAEALRGRLEGVTAGLSPDALRYDYSSIRAAVAEALGSFVLGRKGRVTAALGDLATVAPFADAPNEQLLGLLDALNGGAAEMRGLVSSILTVGAGVVAPDWFPIDSDSISEARRKAQLAATVATFLTSGSEGADATVRVATGITPASQALEVQLDALARSMSSMFTSLGSDEESLEFWLGDRTLLEAVAASLETWQHDVESGAYRLLQRWLAFTAEVASLDDDSLAAFRRQLRSGEISAADARNAFDRALFGATLTDVGETHALDVFENTTHDRRIAEFMSDLEERQRLLRSVIPKMLVDGRGFDSSATVGQVGSLRQELGSKRRGARSIRSLLSSYSDLISSITPCFLMSPGSVANFIEPGAIDFDLVIFDEASQITVSSAVGVLGRAKAAVIVGDSKQMPPTTFGMAAGQVEDEEADLGTVEGEIAVITDAESILDECVESRMDRLYLTWHYRSEDEVLIQFSNTHYYERRLASFPGPRDVIPGCGIDYRRVEGQFDHGGKRVNVVEADAIVAEVLRRLADPVLRNESIGIVTLNAEQRDLIIEKLRATGDPTIDRALDPASPEDEEDREALVVLNLESVQGRERDVVILGTSFSKRQDGSRMPLNFGPLNAKGGERRLNVAVTRARRKMIVISSFDPSELTNANAVGMVHLREYLEMARSVSAGVRPETVRSADEGQNRHQVAIVDALTERGLIARPNVGLSSFRVDIAVTVPECEERWLVGVLLDGPPWAERTLASDRDALPVSVLEKKMGWPKVARIWLPSWRSDRVGVVAQIEELVRRVAEEPERQPEPVKVLPEPDRVEAVVYAIGGSDDSGRSPAPEVLTRDVLADSTGLLATSDSARPFVAIPDQQVIGSLDALERDPAIGRAHSASVVETFGPMPKGHALKATLNAFGLGRVREERLRQFDHLIEPSQVVATEFGEFVFPSNLLADGRLDRSVYTWYRASTASQRKVEEIDPYEFANCAVTIVKQGFSVAPDELIEECLKAFGYSRKTSETKEYAARLVQWCVAQGYLVEVDGSLRISQ